MKEPMTMEQLINSFAGEAIDWLIENQYDYALVPRMPTEAMCEAFHEAQDEWEDGNGLESPDCQWEAMLKAYEAETSQTDQHNS